MEELKRLQFFYGLKSEIRYGEKRTDPNNPESVAEHVYGMHVLFDYFWPLEDSEAKWNQVKMRQMINFHDLDEVIVGDVIGYLKTAADKEKEVEAQAQVLDSVPQSMRSTLEVLLEEYETRESVEAKFIKAIDKIEPVVHVYNENGKRLLNEMRTTKEQHDSIKLPYFKPFPVIHRFYDVSINKMVEEGFFV